MRLVGIFLSLLAMAALPGGFGGAAHAEGTAPTKILLAFEGGAGRPLAFHLAERMREALGRPVIVEERPGASGRIAAVALKNATADGKTLALLPIAVPVLMPMTFKDVSYNAVHDFSPISQIATYGFAFAVPNSHPARSFPEFVDWLKTHPSQAFYGTGAAGSLPHFLGVMIAKATGTNMTHVAYKGYGPMSLDLAEGTIPAGISVISDLIEMHRAGRIRILATSGGSRQPLLPEVPTFAEQGYPMVQASGWVGVFAPAKTPKAVIDEWSAALAAAVRSPQTRQKLFELGLDPTGTTPEEFAAIVTTDIARWSPIIQKSGFRAD
ncbi:MAG: hypothetical protein EOP82_26795 [Variovorax sp.]|nr:MAG: hypothetical protein EOP82_26795 [Variovorax sp.]